MTKLSVAGRLQLTTAIVALAATLQAAPVEAQEAFDLGTIVLDWENLGRPIEETSGATTVVDGEEAEAPSNQSIFEAIEGTANVITSTDPNLPVVRGIDGSGGVFGGKAFTAGSYPRVNVLVDGRSRIPSAIGAIGQDIAPWDVSRIEVAKGPQTTAGGRSSLAGAINVVTNDPIFEREGALRFSYRTRDGEPVYGFSGMYNTPLSESVALRLAFDGVNGESFVNVVDPSVAADRSDIEAIEAATLRAKLLFAPETIPGLELVLGVEREVKESLNSDEVDIGSNDFELSNFAFNTSEGRLEQSIFSLKGRYEATSNLTFEGRLSYTDADQFIKPTNVLFNLNQNFENVQAEFLARYTGDGFLRRGVVGFSYENQEEFGRNSTLGTTPGGFNFDVDGEFTNRSIFAEAEFALSDQLFAFAGGRYEDQDITRDVVVDFGAGQGVGTVRTSDTNFSPRVGLRYEFSDFSSVGYQYSEGYRPGSIDIDLRNPSIVTTFEGETLKQHEVWARYRDPNDRFGVNATAFYYGLEDAQVNGAGPGFLIGNVPSAEGYGLELDGFVKTGERSRLTGSLGLLSTKITDAGTDPDSAGLLGTRLPDSARLTLGLGYEYETASGWDFGVKALHVADRAASFVGDQPLPDYTTVGLTAGYDTVWNGSPVRIDAFVNNLFDEEVILFTDTGLGVKQVAEPLTVGVSVSMKF